MDLLIQQIFNGLSLGAIYAVFGVGFGLMLATLGVLNAAHGTFATWGGLIVLYLVNDMGLGLWLSILIGVIAAGLLAVAVDFIAFQPIRSRSGDLLPALITSIGVWIFLLAAAQIATGAKTSRYAPEATPQGSFTLLGLSIGRAQLISIAALIIVGFGLHALLHRTKVGAAMRAVGTSPMAASLGGVNPVLIVAITAFLSGAIAGLAGITMGLSTSTVNFLLGEALLLKGFAAVIIGGFGDVRGTILGGLLIGVAEVLTAQYVSGSLRDAITFGLLLAFLVFRPRGLFGSATAMKTARA
ncbi:branched-chain amino acid ABC transporter permease [Janibacter alittae]|uniref:Branched-chain amino acid ABC transporter permease n=1 Tax=Janibacter alittae TaxID=3115209 RepID=A0ABZ2MHH8_9MICO